MKCSIIDRPTISASITNQHTVDQSLYAKLAQDLCKMRWISPGDLARSPDCNPIENIMLKRCREVIEGDGDLSIIEHFIHCDAYEKKNMEWHAINDAINGNMPWFPCYSCRSGHKSQKCEIFFHTFCHNMHDFKKTMPSIGRHIPLNFCVRKFPIHYRLNDQNR